MRIGPVTFRAAKGCDRCVFTTIDPDTAAKGHEPLFALARHRRWDGKVWFGVTLIPDEAGPDASDPPRRPGRDPRPGIRPRVWAAHSRHVASSARMARLCQY